MFVLWLEYWWSLFQVSKGQQIIIVPGNSFAPNKPKLNPALAQIYDDIWRHYAISSRMVCIRSQAGKHVVYLSVVGLNNHKNNV